MLHVFRQLHRADLREDLVDLPDGGDHRDHDPDVSAGRRAEKRPDRGDRGPQRETTFADAAREELPDDPATTCPECGGARLNAEARAFRFHGLGIADFARLSVEEAAAWFEAFRPGARETAIAEGPVRDLRSRLAFLRGVGLGYLSLDRAVPSLSGGESQRIRLAAQLGSNLRGVCYVLDEPTIGLHPRDTAVLLDTLVALRDKGNTVVVVEHDEQTMRRAVEISEKLGLTLAIETEVSNVVSSPEKARRIMDDIGSPLLKMILDMANLFPAGTAKKENVRAAIKRAVDFFGGDIVILHGKDIREGDGIDFCGTGDGIIDFTYAAALMRKIGYKGDMFLHGIYDEDKFMSAAGYWRDCWERSKDSEDAK